MDIGQISSVDKHHPARVGLGTGFHRYRGHGAVDGDVVGGAHEGYVGGDAVVEQHLCYSDETD